MWKVKVSNAEVPRPHHSDIKQRLSAYDTPWQRHASYRMPSSLDVRYCIENSRDANGFEFASSAVGVLRSTLGRHRRIWRHTRFCRIAAAAAAAAARRRSGAEQSEDRSLKFPGGRSAYRCRRRRDNDWFTIRRRGGGRPTAALVALGESDRLGSSDMHGRSRRSSGLWFQRWKGRGGDRERGGKRCRGKLDASTAAAATRLSSRSLFMRTSRKQRSIATWCSVSISQRL